MNYYLYLVKQKNKNLICISAKYDGSYCKHIAVMILNNKKALYDLQLADFKSKQPDCICLFFNYVPAEHIITGDINIIDNADLQDISARDYIIP